MSKEIRRTDLSEAVSHCTMANLRKASRAVTQAYDAALAPSGLRGTQFTLLAAAALLEEATVTQLAEFLVADRTTLTRNLAPLEKAGLLRLHVGRDRRWRVVSLTGRGRERLAFALPLWRQAQTRTVRALGKRKWKGLLGHLSAVISVVR
jgi:DNA-binding MarR family transcriptional regulator